MLEHDIDVALAGNVPDRLAELSCLAYPVVIFRRIHPRHLAPALEILAVDHSLGAEPEHIVALGFVRDHTDGIGAGRRAKLHAEHAKSARAAPDQYVITRLERMRRMAEQHAIGGGEGERVAGRLFPGEMRGLGHQLARLHATELTERAIRRLVAPDALRG